MLNVDKLVAYSSKAIASNPEIMEAAGAAAAFVALDVLAPVALVAAPIAVAGAAIYGIKEMVSDN